MIQLQVDICILDTILMLPKFGPESEALATGLRIQITCDFPGGGFGPLSPSGSSHENSLFRCFAHGLKMCMSCALDIIVKLFFLSLFMNL